MEPRRRRREKCRTAAAAAATLRGELARQSCQSESLHQIKGKIYTLSRLCSCVCWATRVPLPRTLYIYIYTLIQTARGQFIERKRSRVKKKDEERDVVLSAGPREADIKWPLGWSVSETRFSRSSSSPAQPNDRWSAGRPVTRRKIHHHPSRFKARWSAAQYNMRARGGGAVHIFAPPRTVRLSRARRIGIDLLSARGPHAHWRPIYTSGTRHMRVQAIRLMNYIVWRFRGNRGKLMNADGRSYLHARALFLAF